MRYYGTITGLSAGGGAAAPPPAVIPHEDDDEMVPGAAGVWGLGLICLIGAILMIGMIYIIMRALTRTRRGR